MTRARSNTGRVPFITPAAIAGGLLIALFLGVAIYLAEDRRATASLKQEQQNAARFLERLGDKFDLYLHDQELRARGVAVELALCGDVDAGNPKSFTHAEAEAFGNSEGCEWLGRRDDVLEQIAASHLLVLPTYREGLPRALLEAGLARRAVVTTTVTGCREVVVDGKSGLLCPPRDAKALANALQTILEDDGLRERLANSLHNRVQEKFSDKIVNPRWWELYREGRP